MQAGFVAELDFEKLVTCLFNKSLRIQCSRPKKGWKNRNNFNYLRYASSKPRRLTRYNSGGTSGPRGPMRMSWTYLLGDRGGFPYRDWIYDNHRRFHYRQNLTNSFVYAMDNRKFNLMLLNARQAFSVAFKSRSFHCGRSHSLSFLCGLSFWSHDRLCLNLGYPHIHCC